VRVVSAAESAARDHAAIADGIPSRALMRVAGTAAAGEIARRFGDLVSRGVAIYAGPGNNGGDAWVVAGALAATGVPVRVTPVGEARSADAIAERAYAEARIGTVGPASGREPIVVDGLLGTGAAGTPRGAIAQAIADIADARRQGATVVALDVPSGIDATTGSADGAVHADLTLTFGTLKRGLTIAREHAGAIAVLDIGLGIHADGADRAPTLIDAAFARAHVPAIAADANKGTRRRLAIVAGAEGMVGAALLAAQGALASGIGLVRLFVAPSNIPVVQASAFESLAHAWPADDATVGHDIDDWAHAVLLGPGLGDGADARALVDRVLRRTRVPIVVDADGLNAFAGRADDLGRLLAGRPAIITPHPGEFARLVGASIDEVLAQRFEIGQALATRLGAAVLLKGVPTIVSSAEATRMVSAAGSPVLAVGGSGDLLAGIIATLLAQTGDALVSASCGAWVHGRAAEAAGGGRVRGITLDDVVRALPAAWALGGDDDRYPVLASLSAVGDAG
jgi:ADP-dependent NAD(P)H-hydrate dehydratase / NAD(P)H-hydrate epimerase